MRFTLSHLATIAATLLALQSVAHADIIPFEDDITAESMADLAQTVTDAWNHGDHDITVKLNSGGGEVWKALATAKVFKQYNVNTLVRGDCSSACTILFAAGKNRTASRYATFMFHAVQVGDIPSRLRYNKKTNPTGLTEHGVAVSASNAWLEAVRWASPSLADKLKNDETLLTGDDTEYSGQYLRKFGYVNNID